MIGEHYKDKWQQPPYWPYIQQPDTATQQEVVNLRKELEELKKLLARAKAYDKANKEPDCEMDDKIAFLRQVAESFGVNLEDVLAGHAPRKGKAKKPRGTK